MYSGEQITSLICAWTQEEKAYVIDSSAAYSYVLTFSQYDMNVNYVTDRDEFVINVDSQQFIRKSSEYFI